MLEILNDQKTKAYNVKNNRLTNLVNRLFFCDTSSLELKILLNIEQIYLNMYFFPISKSQHLRIFAL